MTFPAIWKLFLIIQFEILKYLNSFPKHSTQTPFDLFEGFHPLPAISSNYLDWFDDTGNMVQVSWPMFKPPVDVDLSFQNPFSNVSWKYHRKTRIISITVFYKMSKPDTKIDIKTSVWTMDQLWHAVYLSNIHIW